MVLLKACRSAERVHSVDDSAETATETVMAFGLAETMVPFNRVEINEISPLRPASKESLQQHEVRSTEKKRHTPGVTPLKRAAVSLAFNPAWKCSWMTEGGAAKVAMTATMVGPSCLNESVQGPVGIRKAALHDAAANVAV